MTQPQIFIFFLAFAAFRYTDSINDKFYQYMIKFFLMFIFSSSILIDYKKGKILQNN
jgi:hypothetical protein